MIPGFTEGWKRKPSLVGAECAPELDPEPAVDLRLAGVVLPGDPEDDLAFGLAQPLEDLVFGELRVLGQHRAQRLEHLPVSLMELGMPGVPSYDLVVERLDLLVDHRKLLGPIGDGER